MALDGVAHGAVHAARVTLRGEQIVLSPGGERRLCEALLRGVGQYHDGHAISQPHQLLEHGQAHMARRVEVQQNDIHVSLSEQLPGCIQASGAVQLKAAEGVGVGMQARVDARSAGRIGHDQQNGERRQMVGHRCWRGRVASEASAWEIGSTLWSFA